VAARLGLTPDAWSIGFQSRFGREEWLQPYMDVLLHDYAHTGPEAR
jgi:ferrochelatase